MSEAKNGHDPIIWFEEYGDYLYGYARQRVREQAAEDLVQETFLAAIQVIDSYAGNSSAKTWLTGILKHKIYDYYRRYSRYENLNVEESDFSDNHFFAREDEWDGHWNKRYAPAEWDENSPFQLVAEGEFQMVFSHCLMGLPVRLAHTFVMREVDGLTSDEICTILMITANNYWTMMHRARLHLRRCLEINWFAPPQE